MSVIEEIAGQLFAVFCDCVPVHKEWKNSAKRLKSEHVGVGLDKLYDKARELRRTHRPSVLARARIVLALQRHFHAAGYPAEMTREVLFSLILAAFVGKS